MWSKEIYDSKIKPAVEEALNKHFSDYRNRDQKQKNYLKKPINKITAMLGRGKAITKAINPIATTTGNA